MFVYRRFCNAILALKCFNLTSVTWTLTIIIQIINYHSPIVYRLLVYTMFLIKQKLFGCMLSTLLRIIKNFMKYINGYFLQESSRI